MCLFYSQSGKNTLIARTYFLLNMTTNRAMKRKISIYCVVFSFVLFACEKNTTNIPTFTNEVGKNNLDIFAAASLYDVLSELIDSFKVEYSVEITANFASSGTLARQISHGASPHIYISANKKWADYMDSTNNIIDGSIIQIAQNELVLISPKSSILGDIKIDSTIDLSNILGNDKLCMGDPLHVPAGRYAKQALTYFGTFKRIENKILPTKDVRSALMIVEMQESPIGIVYRTDALKSSKVKIIGSFPANSHEHIFYYAGMCRESKKADDFLDYLKSKTCRAIWKKHGFSL